MPTTILAFTLDRLRICLTGLFNALDIEIFVIRAFGKNFQVASIYIKSSPDCALFLPIPTTNKTPSTPPAFKRPFDTPGFISELPSWALARQIVITVQKDSKMVSLSQTALWTYLILVRSSSEDSQITLLYRTANISVSRTISTRL